MPNGVTKTTYGNRLEFSLSAVLSAVQLPSEIRVLDLPASTGAASLRSIAQLQEGTVSRPTCWGICITGYCMIDADSAFSMNKETCSRLGSGFFSSAFTESAFQRTVKHFLTAAPAFPHGVMARYLRKRYPFRPSDGYQRLLVVHPEVEQMPGQKRVQPTRN
jgi:hypothetical protein